LRRISRRRKTLVEDDPADVEGDGDAEEKDAESDEEGNGSAATGEVHGAG